MKTFHAKTVEQCWEIARQEAEMYQRRMSREVGNLTWCRVARDAASRIALRIRHGRLIHYKRKW